MESTQFIGVTADETKVLVQVELTRTSTLQALWDLSSEKQLMVLAPQFSGLLVHFFSEAESVPEWKALLQQMAQEGFVSSSHVNEEVVPVSVIGHRFAQDAKALGQVLDILAQAQIWVTMGSASATALTVAIARNRAQEAVQVLHEKLVAREPHA